MHANHKGKGSGSSHYGLEVGGQYHYDPIIVTINLSILNSSSSVSACVTVQIKITKS